MDKYTVLGSITPISSLVAVVQSALSYRTLTKSIFPDGRALKPPNNKPKFQKPIFGTCEPRGPYF